MRKQRDIIRTERDREKTKCQNRGKNAKTEQRKEQINTMTGEKQGKNTNTNDKYEGKGEIPKQTRKCED